MSGRPLSLEVEGDREVVVTRRFEAPPEAVYRAHIEPELLQKWVLGPEGWTMPVCVSDPRPGGAIRFEWVNPDGGGFYLTGEYVSLEPHRRVVHIERMHVPDPTPDNRVETCFEPDGDGTLLTVRMTLPSEEARRAMLDTGMAEGMETSYARLDAMGRGAEFEGHKP